MSKTDSDSRDPRQGSARGPVAAATELGGDLRCRRCGYNLRGLSIRSVCPECGLPVRATLLAVVDPRAKELQAIYFPRVTALGLVLWTHCALLCALLIAALRAQHFGMLPDFSDDLAEFTREAVTLLSAIAAVGAAVLIAPHPGLSRVERCMAISGVLCAFIVSYALHQIHEHIDPAVASVRVDIRPRLDRTLWKLLADFAMLGSLLLLRPNARVLAARSLLMRTGQVNRQTLASLAAVVGVCIVADGLSLVANAAWARGSVQSVAELSSQIFLLVGSALLLAGFVGLVVDSWRLLPVILDRPLHIDDLVQPEESR